MATSRRPGPLDRVERFMESAFEGTIQRLLGAKLQPIQLAKAAARQMERQQLVGPSGIEVPNRFEIQLHASDFALFERWQGALERELASYLERYALQRGWTQPGRAAVCIREVAGTSRSRPRVEASFVDTAPALPGDESPEPAPAATRALSTVDPAAAQERLEAVQPSPRGSAWLVSENGERFDVAAPVTTLGRALENLVVVPDPRVSRFHAEIRRDGDRFLLKDLGSSNGTMIGDARADHAELRNGDVISLGGYRLTFETGDRAWGPT
jgi:hypothetical protein